VALAATPVLIYGATAATARGDEVNLFFGVLRHHLFGLMILGGMVLLVGLRTRRWLGRSWGMGLVAAWLAFNLFSVNWRFNLEERATPGVFTPNGPVAFLQANLPGPQADRGQTQVYHASSRANEALRESPGRIVSGGLLPGGNNAASVYNLEDLTGNTPLQLADVAVFLQQMPGWRLWQLLNVRYIVDQRDIGDTGLRPVFEEDGLKVFEMGDPFPRAWFVSEVSVVSGTEQVIERLSAEAFDLRQSAIVAQPLAIQLDDASAASVEIVDVSPTRLSLEVEAAGRHLLVLSQIYYPGWRVEIDGRPEQLLQVNLVQQGLVVPPGGHSIQITFWPLSFMIGAVASAVGIGICAAILIWPGAKHQQ
jgi:hypothetical protein